MSSDELTINPVILSGGSGSRLWPSSRASLPKQFIEFREELPYLVTRQKRWMSIKAHN